MINSNGFKISSLGMYLLSAVVVLIVAYVFLSGGFEDVQKKKDPPKSSFATDDKAQHSTEIADQNSNPKPLDSTKTEFQGIVLTTYDLLVYPPRAGQLDLKVAVDQPVVEGQIIAELKPLASSLSGASLRTAILQDEITSHDRSIAIAYDDIEYLDKQIDKLQYDIQNAEFKWFEAQERLEPGNIGEKEMETKKEVLEQLKMHLQAAEDMLQTKYREINQYNSRISEIIKETGGEAFESGISSIISPAKGSIRNLLAESGEIVNEDIAIVEIAPANILTVGLDVHVPDSMNGVKIKVRHNQAQGLDIEAMIKKININEWPREKGIRSILQLKVDSNDDLSAFQVGSRIHIVPIE